jgi:hypothetical protein
MTILIAFHLSGFRNLKHYYLYHICKHLRQEFPRIVSYNRFVQLQHKVIMPLAIFLRTKALGQCTAISFIDSTPVRACHIKRDARHKTLKGFVKKGHRSMGWFFSFKLYLIINDKREKYLILC